jgi:hypothetical protein
LGFSNFSCRQEKLENVLTSKKLKKCHTEIKSHH